MVDFEVFSLRTTLFSCVFRINVNEFGFGILFRSLYLVFMRIRKMMDIFDLRYESPVDFFIRVAFLVFRMGRVKNHIETLFINLP